MLGIELGYQNFGSMNFRTGSAEGELEAESFSAAAMVRIPFTKELKGFLLAGVEEMDFTEDSTATTFDFKEDTESFFGIGALLSRNDHSEYRITLASHADGDIIRLSIGGNLDLTGF